MPAKFELIAPCFFGCESTAKFELTRIGAENIRVEDGRLSFCGGAEMIAAANLNLRTVERAEDTCRMLEVHLELMVDDPAIDAQESATALFMALGLPPAEGPLTASDVLDGDISKTIRITSQNIVNSQPGVYNVTAQVDSRLGEPVVLPLKVVITTGETQLIWLKDYLIYLSQGASFNAAGYIDSVVAPDGSTLAASQVSVDDPVNTSVPGVYYVGYTVAAQGQSYTVYLTVVVE